jgi:hypothetical protein
MEQSPFPEWFPFVAVGWVALIIGLSVIVRRRAGKPIIPRVPDGALYAERWASGPWASNCLLVYVTDEVLSVVPRFPFNLMFLPEVYGLERTVPLRAIREVKQTRGFGFISNVAVTYGDRPRKLRLKLRDPGAFVEALGRSGRLEVHTR